MSIWQISYGKGLRKERLFDNKSLLFLGPRLSMTPVPKSELNRTR